MVQRCGDYITRNHLTGLTAPGIRILVGPSKRANERARERASKGRTDGQCRDTCVASKQKCQTSGAQWLWGSPDVAARA